MFGTGELILILCVALILFGGKRLPELARSLGIGIREFKKACQGEDETEIHAPRTKKGEPAKEPVTIVVEPEHKEH